MRTTKPVLIVEDDDIHAATVKRALKELNVTNEIVRMANGDEALKYLENQGSKMPCVILLDLNMPKMSGIEFLKIMKSGDRLRQIPVIVMTTSDEKHDIVESFKLGVAGYVVKPFSYKDFVEQIRIVNLYWTLSELPEGE